MSDKKEIAQPLKETSLKAYKSRLLTFARKSGHQKIPEKPMYEWVDLNLLDDLLDKYNKQSAKSMLNALIHFCTGEENKELYDELYTRRKYISHNIWSSFGTREKSDNEIRRWKKVEDLQSIYERSYNNFFSNPNELDLIILFHLYPFHDDKFGVLRNDLPTIHTFRAQDSCEEPPADYYDGKLFHFADDKTSRWTGAIVMNVPEGLREILDRWIWIINLHKVTDY